MWCPWSAVYKLDNDNYGGSFYFPHNDGTGRVEQIPYNSLRTLHSVDFNNSDWGAVANLFAVDDAARAVPFGSSDLSLSAYYLNYHNGYAPRDSPYTDPNSPNNPSVPMHVHGSVSLGESDFSDDGSYARFVGASEHGEYQVDGFSSQQRSVPRKHQSGTSSSQAAANTLGPKPNTTTHPTNYTTDLGGGQFDPVGPGNSSIPTDVSEVVVTARPPPIPISFVPVAVVINNPRVITDPTLINVSDLTLKTPQVLIARGITRVPPISPSILAKILRLHGDQAFSAPSGEGGGRKTAFVTLFRNVAALQFIMAAVVANGYINDSAMLQGNAIVMEYDFGGTMGTNQFGEQTSVVRVVLAPQGGGVGGVVTMYPVTARR